MENYTTIEQSKKLVELGLNLDTADMCYIQHFDEFYNEVTFIEEDPVLTHTIVTIDLPCWSLGALLEVMPKENVKPFEDSNPFIGYGDGIYRCVYLNGDWESSHQTVGYTLIEAAYNMVCWLLENSYIKKEK